MQDHENLFKGFASFKTLLFSYMELGQHIMNIKLINYPRI